MTTMVKREYWGNEGLGLQGSGAGRMESLPIRECGGDELHHRSQALGLPPWDGVGRDAAPPDGGAHVSVQHARDF